MVNNRIPWQHQVYVGVLLIIFFAAGFALGNLNSVSEAQNSDTLAPVDADQTFAPFWEVYNLIQKNYLDTPNTETLVDGAIKGLVDSLGDPYSGYIEPEMFPYINDNLEGSIEGIGAVVSEIETTGEIQIVNVIQGTPAALAGLREGDIFLKVDDVDVVGLSYLDIVARVRGPAGSEVRLTMRRDTETLEFSVERARIEIPNIELDILDGDVGYIKLNQFTAEARRQLDEAMEEIDVNNRSGLILDLRGNPGGYLSTAIEIASAFIEEGVVLYEAFGDGTEQIFNADGTFAHLSVPLIVLIDERSASASELVAGAWQDYGVATIIGTTSLGKGTVQTQNNIINGGGLRLTIARWLTPQRNWIHGQGVEPDIKIEWSVEDRAENPEDDPQLQGALDFLQSQELETAAQ